MKRSISKTKTLATAFLMMLTAGLSFGQMTFLPANKQTAQQVLNNIYTVADNGGAPTNIYPQEFLNQLQGLGDSIYPPAPTLVTPTATARTTMTSSSMALSGMSQSGSQSQSAAAFYSVTDLGTLGGSSSYAFGINNSGTVVGYSYIDQTYNVYAFEYTNGYMLNISSGTNGTIFNQAQSVNGPGQIVGYGSVPSDNNLAHAMLYSGGSLYDLSPGLTFNCYATCINSSSQIVGYGYPKVNPLISQSSYSTYIPDTSTNQFQDGFLITGNTMQDLGTIDGFTSSQANGINDGGEIVGSSADSNHVTHAFVCLNNSAMTDLDGALGGYNYSVAYGINNNGQIVGVAGNDAFVYSLSSGQVTDIGMLNNPDYSSSQGYGINNNGDAVGQLIDNNSSFQAHAFVCPSGGSMTDLNNLIDTNSGWQLECANAINDNGQIAGYGINSNGDEHAFLMDPYIQWTYAGYPQGDSDTSVVPSEFGDNTALAVAEKNGESTSGYGSDGRAVTRVYGCALCSVAAMITTINGFESMTPQILDQDLNATSGGYEDGCDMNWWVVGKATGCPITYIDSKQITSQSDLEQYLNDYCWGNRYRVILELSAVENGGKPESHYVLVVGKTADDWIIFDPGWSSAFVNGSPDNSALDSLNAHLSGFSTYSSSGQKLNSWQFMVIGVRTWQVNANSASFVKVAHSPVELLVTDPNGNSVGYNPDTNSDLFQIPGASYIRDFPIMNADDDSGSPAGDTNAIKAVYIPSPLGGTYNTTLIGTSPGDYTLDTSITWPGNSELDQTITGTTDLGVITTNTSFVIAPSIITSSTISGGMFNLIFTTQANVTYGVYEDSGLTDTNWTLVQTLAATGTSSTVSVPINSSIMFYRVKSQ